MVWQSTVGLEDGSMDLVGLKDGNELGLVEIEGFNDGREGGNADLEGAELGCELMAGQNA